MAKKKSVSNKKTPAKKKAASKPARAPSKKASSKKAPAKKKPAAKKKTAVKKAPVKKAAVKKATTKKTVTKKAVSKKPVTKKKASAKKPASKKTKKTAAKPNVPAGPRYRVASTSNFKDGKAAAAKLSAAAGLNIQRSTSSNDLQVQDYEKLTKSPFPRRELNKFRQILFEKRAQLVGDVSSMESEALTSGGSGSLSNVPQHMADQGSDTYDQTLALDLAASQRDLLKEIDDAIDRIDANTFGICEMLGKPINPERLEHTPWARFCIEAARQIERSGYAS